MGATIAIIILSLTVLFLCWKLIPLMIELGKYRQLEETNIVPEITNLRRENDILNFDIEKIIGGDEYVILHWKEIIEKRKSHKRILEFLK